MWMLKFLIHFDKFRDGIGQPWPAFYNLRTSLDTQDTLVNYAQASGTIQGVASDPMDSANTGPSLQHASALLVTSMGRQRNDGDKACSMSPLSICWKRTSNVFTEALWSDTDFVAIDISRAGADERDKCIGGVLQEEHGPHKGMWAWSVTVCTPGSRVPFPANGREAKMSDAVRCVVVCYERMLRVQSAK
jgi:hypothetical protein